MVSQIVKITMYTMDIFVGEAPTNSYYWPLRTCLSTSQPQYSIYTFIIFDMRLNCKLDSLMVRER